jgi:hypothetical protein
MVVERVEQGTIDEVGRPNHGCGPDKEATGKTCHAIASAKRCDSKEKLEGKAKLLFVENLLCEKNISRVQSTATICSLLNC